MTTWTGAIPTFVSGDTTTVPTNLNTLGDALQATSEAWTAYTPTWTASVNPALGNGSFTGSAYAQVNKLIFFRIVLTMGTTTTYGTGTWLLTLPVAPINAGVMTFAGNALNSGVGYFPCRMTVEGGLAAGQILTPATTAGNADRGVSGTVPFTWGTVDSLTIIGSYQAA